MQKKPKGLKLVDHIWYIDKVVRVGERSQRIRGSTRLREEHLEDAIKLLREQENGVRCELILGTEATEHTFMEAAAKYIAALERRGKATDQATRDCKKLMPYIGTLPLSHVHQDQLASFENDQRKDGIASGTVGRTYHTMIAVLHYAARVLQEGNAPWFRHAVPKIELPDWQDAREPYRLTWDDQDRLVEQLPSHLVPIVLFAVATGAREQEIVSLRWDALVHADGLAQYAAWWIPPEVRKGSARKKAREQEGRRYLVANQMARSVVEGQVGKDLRWVFPSPRGGRMHRANNHGFRTARQKAGLSCRFHDLRHTFGERAAVAGVPWEYRKVLLGHEIRDITAHYSAPGLKLLLEEAEKVTREGAVILRAVPRTVSQNVTQTKTAV